MIERSAGYCAERVEIQVREQVQELRRPAGRETTQGWERSDRQRRKKFFFRAGIYVAEIGRFDDAIGGDAGDKLARGDSRDSVQAAALHDFPIHPRGGVYRAPENPRRSGEIQIEPAMARVLPKRREAPDQILERVVRRLNRLPV